MQPGDVASELPHNHVDCRGLPALGLRSFGVRDFRRKLLVRSQDVRLGLVENFKARVGPDFPVGPYTVDTDAACVHDGRGPLRKLVEAHGHQGGGTRDDGGQDQENQQHNPQK